jgi:hypothetical protein
MYQAESPRVGIQRDRPRMAMLVQLHGLGSMCIDTLASISPKPSDSPSKRHAINLSFDLAELVAMRMCRAY